MELVNPIAFNFGPIRGAVYGGPYRRYEPTRRLFGINMAAEIKAPCNIHVRTPDFSVPPVEDMENAVIGAIRAMKEGNDIYAGCMGGIGRTGLFIGCMAKTWGDFEKHLPGYVMGMTYGGVDPVVFTRQFYKSHAIETSEQEAFVRNFDTTRVLEAVEDMLYVPTPPESALEAFVLWLHLLFKR